MGWVNMNTTNEVGDGGQAQSEGEAADVANSHEVEHQGCQQVDCLGSQDGALGPLPAVFDGGDQSAAFAQLIADAFEVDDERVCGLADGHDETGHTGQGQPVVFGPARGSRWRGRSETPATTREAMVTRPRARYWKRE